TIGSTRRASAMVAMLMLWIAWTEVKPAMAMPRDPAAQFRREQPLLIRALADGRPVAVNEITLFLQADFYLDSELLKHLYYLEPAEEDARRYPWQSLFNLYAPLLVETVPVRSQVATWREFSARDSCLLLVDSGSFWAYDVLPREGWRLTLVST